MPAGNQSSAGPATWWEVADSVYLASIMNRARPDGAAEDISEQPPGASPVVNPSAEPPIGSAPRQSTAQPPPEPAPAADDYSLAEPAGHDGVAQQRAVEPELRLVHGERAGQFANIALSDPAELLRALWPLKRNVRSWREEDLSFDAEATAERALLDGTWWPVTRPGTQRRFDLTVVVDGSPSLTLWRSRVTSFLRLLEQRGAFRTIQLRLLDTRHDPGGQPVLRGGAFHTEPHTPPRSPAEVSDSGRRRIVLVVTDGIDDCWRQDTVGPVLAQWARSMHVCVVNLLPERLWGRTGLLAEHATLADLTELKPNRRWTWELIDAWVLPDPAVLAGTVPIPVIELESSWLTWWAQLVTGGHRDPVKARVLLAGTKPRPMARGGDSSIQDRVRQFRSVASPEAFKLATLLAAVPVNVPIARTLQAELAPESGPEHLAEVLASGLLRTPTGLSSWDEARFELPIAARELLLTGARRSQTARAIQVAADQFGDQITELARLRAALLSPDATPDPTIAEEVALDHVVMKALSGPYIPRAERLSPLVPPEPLRPASESKSESLPNRIRTKEVSDTMSNTADTRAGAAEESAEKSQFTKPSVTSVPHAQPTDDSDLGDRTAGRDARAERPLGPPGLGLAGVHEGRTEGIPPIWGNVPPRNPNFTGRGELLEQLSQRLIAGGATAILPAALHGMGGIGKTQMAVEYIYRRLHQYDIVWWVQATQPAQIRAGLTELAQYMGLPGSQEAHTAVPAVREALRVGKPFSRWLLVFDSAESPDVVRPFFPNAGPGEILITSRNPDWASIARPLEVKVFNRDESVELLRKRGPEISDADADQLADRLGDLPLAIEQAAAWRAETGMPVQEYLRLFDEKVAEILGTSTPADYELSVAAAWNVSFDELRSRNPAAHRLLQVCAFFAPEPISRDLFVGVRGLTIAPELDTALRDPIQLSRAIRDINRYGLAKIDHRTNTLLLHRLVQLILRNRMSPQRLAEMRHGAHVLLANADPNDPANSKQWGRYQEVLPHIYSSELVECDDPWVRNLVVNLGSFLYFWGDHQEAVTLLDSAVNVWSTRLGESDQHVLQAASILGWCLWALGRYPEAAEVNERTLALRRTVSGENAEETIIAELRVTVDMKARGEFLPAREINEAIYRKAKGLYGDDDPITLQTAHDLGVTLRLCGDYRAALATDERNYQKRLEILGYDDSRTLSTLSGLILDRQELGEYPRARLEHQQVAERVTKILGEDKLGTLHRKKLLAVALRKDGAHTEALKLSEQTRTLARRRYGDDHPETMACAIAHSIDLRHSGDLEGACVLGEETFNRYRAKLGEEHPHTAAAAADLAVTFRLRGNAESARQLSERSLEQFRVKLGPDHPHSIVTMINLASDLAALGNAQAAVELGVEAQERSTRILGPDHPTSLAAALNLALDKRTLGAEEEAAVLLNETVARYRQVLTEAHPATTQAQRGIRADCDIDPLPN